MRTYNLVEYIHLDEMRIIHCDTSRTGTQHTWQSSRSLLYYIGNPNQTKWKHQTGNTTQAKANKPKEHAKEELRQENRHLNAYLQNTETNT